MEQKTADVYRQDLRVGYELREELGKPRGLNRAPRSGTCQPDAMDNGGTNPVKAGVGGCLTGVVPPWHILLHASIMIDTGVYISCGRYLLRDKAFFVMVKKGKRCSWAPYVQPYSASCSLV